MVIISKSRYQTQKLAADFAKKIGKIRLKPGNGAAIIALQGNLGSGKTTFVQGFCRALGVKHGVTSPTFIIMRKHEMAGSRHPASGTKRWVYHFDLYRIKNSRELSILGFKKIIRNPENIVLIEWPEKVKKLLPENSIWINFKHLTKPNERKIETLLRR